MSSWLRLIALIFGLGTLCFLGADTLQSLQVEPEFKSPWGLLHKGESLPAEGKP